MEKAVRRGRHRIEVENEIIRKREKQLQHDLLWNGTSKYFDQWQKRNSKYEEWTSPRYYETNNKLMEEIEKKRNKEKMLESKRDKLRKLFRDENETYEIELMVKRSKPQVEVKDVSVSTDVLKEINSTLKSREEERRRHEAEIKLYHQWRVNNPIVRQYESKFKHKDLKLSWLDQQIEKRMQKEKEEEENKRLVKEHEEQLKKQKEEQQILERYLCEKRAQLKANLEKQMEEVRKRKLVDEELDRVESEEMSKKAILAEIEENMKAEEKRRLNRECALYNIRQYKMKLKQKAADIEENLKQEQLLITKLKKLHLEDLLVTEEKRKKVKEDLDRISNCLKQQENLEKQRQKYLEFLFDSEAKSVYEKQNEQWKLEERSRQKLVEEVLNTLRRQIEEKLEYNRNKRLEIEKEREELLEKIKAYEDELKNLQHEEERRKKEFKTSLDEELKIKNARKQLEENTKLKQINEELDRIRKEEEKLQMEIARIQSNSRRCTPTRRPSTSRFF